MVASTTGGFDINAGVEFRIARQLNLWLQMNNLFNDKYQRWNQYSVYGFNILGGVIFYIRKIDPFKSFYVHHPEQIPFFT